MWTTWTTPLAGRLRALQRRLAAADRDLDAARLALLGLGDADLEHALVERRGDRRGVDALRQGERAAELAGRRGEPVEAVALDLVLLAALARDREHAVLDLDLDVVAVEA